MKKLPTNAHKYASEISAQATLIRRLLIFIIWIKKFWVESAQDANSKRDWYNESKIICLAQQNIYWLITSNYFSPTFLSLFYTQSITFDKLSVCLPQSFVYQYCAFHWTSLVIRMTPIANILTHQINNNIKYEVDIGSKHSKLICLSQ